MVCPKCGHANPDIAQFCGKCGTALAPSEPSSPRSGSAVSQEMKIGVVIGTILIPILGIVLGIIYMADANPGKKAAGRLWLLVGIGAILLYCIFAGILGMLGSVTQSRGGAEASDSVSLLRPILEGAIRHADTAEMQAQRELDERYLYPLYMGKALQEETAAIRYLRNTKTVGVMHLDGQVFDSFSVEPGGSRAAVHLVEVWSGAYQSSETDKCVARLPRHRVPQTIFLERTATGWMIDSITFHGAGPKPVACS